MVPNQNFRPNQNKNFLTVCCTGSCQAAWSINNKAERYWWVSIANAATYIGGAGGADLTEDNITAELLEEVVRFADLKPPADT